MTPVNYNLKHASFRFRFPIPVSHMGTDLGYRATTSSVVALGTTSYGLTLGTWHHIALTYIGGTGDAVESLYVDGTLVNSGDGRFLNIRRHPTVIVGSFRWNDGSNGPEASTVGIGRLRLHDGALTSAQVAANFLTEAPSFLPSPTQASHRVIF